MLINLKLQPRKQILDTYRSFVLNGGVLPIIVSLTVKEAILVLEKQMEEYKNSLPEGSYILQGGNPKITLLFVRLNIRKARYYCEQAETETFASNSLRTEDLYNAISFTLNAIRELEDVIRHRNIQRGLTDESN